MTRPPTLGSHPLRQILPYLGVNWGRFALALVLGVAGLGASVALGATSAWLIARASQMPPILYLNTAVVAVRFFGISKALFRYMERLASHHVALDGMAILRTRLYESLARTSPAHLWQLHRGDLLARVGGDVDAVGDVVVKAYLPFGLAVLVGTLTSAGIALLDPVCGLALALALAGAGILGPLLTIRSARLAELADQRARTRISDGVMRVMDSACELTILGRDREALDDIRLADAELTAARDAASRPAAWAQTIEVACLVGACVATTWIGINAVHAGTLSEVALAVVALTPLAAFEAVAGLGSASVQLVRSSGAARRLLDLMDETPAPAPAEDTPATSDLEARGATIGWPDGPPLLTDLSMKVAPGRALAIVGPSGIGKTTLLTTLAGIIPPLNGHVLLGGVAPTCLTRETAAGLVSLTTEDAHIFHTSVLENIRVARGDLSREDAHRLLEDAGLGDWVDQAPDGLDTIIGSSASTLSGGERRRLLLARALASRAPILLVDEPGEHLDPDLADALIRDILSLAHSPRPRGILIVTHRITPLDAADEVIVIERDHSGQARITARGSHDELTATLESYRTSLAEEATRVD